MTLKLDLKTIDKQVIEGLDFMSSHFETSHYPRIISTKTTENRQILISNKQEMIARFRQSNYQDCRVNAYSYYDNVDVAPVSFLFIDLDLSSFSTKEDLHTAVSTTLSNIKNKLNGTPTVLWTGNGYHIYQPLEVLRLSSISHFNKYDCVPKKFLRYAAMYLSDKNSDKNNYQSPKSCMLRIPYSLNSKCLDKYSYKSPQVKIIQRWDGTKSEAGLLLADFYAYLKSEKIKEDNYEQTENIFHWSGTNTIEWVDKLLKTPISDYRKNAISLILVPYFITINQWETDETTNKIKEWLDECSKLRRLDFNPNYRISTAITYVQQNRIKPLRLSTLQLRNKDLYNLLGIGV